MNERLKLVNDICMSFPPEIIWMIEKNVIESIEECPGKYVHLYPDFCGMYSKEEFEKLVITQLQSRIQTKYVFENKYFTVRLWPVSAVNYSFFANCLRIPDHIVYIQSIIALLKSHGKIKSIKFEFKHGIKYIFFELAK